MNDTKQGNKLWLLLAAMALSACAVQPQSEDVIVSDSALLVESAHVALLAGKLLPQAHTQADSCRLGLGKNTDVRGEGLNTSNIRLLSWNIQKSQNSGWHQDLSSMSDSRDLVLIQEASLDQQGFIGSVALANHWSFAKGYSTPARQTGVMTFSRTKPLTHCAFSDLEPWLRTPKATSITEFALNESPKTLVVVNIHAINFSLGLEDFRRQIVRVEKVLADHKGPIIFSGDFNTWHDDRNNIVQQVVENLGMSELVFDQDMRTQVFGQHLDHIYIRGLHSLSSSTKEVHSSDHNPMFATFKI